METISYEYYYCRENGDETELQVTAEYSPEEPMVRYYPDGSGYPGAPAELNVYSVKLGEREIINFLTSEEIEEIKDKGWVVVGSADDND